MLCFGGVVYRKNKLESVTPFVRFIDTFPFIKAGIHPPPVSHLVYQPEQILDRLARDRTLVSCQLLARQINASASVESGSIAYTNGEARKRAISSGILELSGHVQGTKEKGIKPMYANRDPPLEVAICRVTYRPTYFQLFPTDVATQLIASGNASVSSSIFGNDATYADSERRSIFIEDTSQRIQDLRNDVKYLDRLAKAEFEAAKQSVGMWSIPEVRETKREVVDEIEFQTKANFFRKLWRWMRGG